MTEQTVQSVSNEECRSVGERGGGGGEQIKETTGSATAVVPMCRSKRV